VGNGRILREGPFKGLWIQPSAGTPAAPWRSAHCLALLENKPRARRNTRYMHGAFWGPYTNKRSSSFSVPKSAYER
jgi:carbamoyltransferase